MGRDKAKISIDGVPQAGRIVCQFLESGIPVTVLGKEPINGAALLRDKNDNAGPIAALSAFVPKAQHVFVASCDLPKFDITLVQLLGDKIGNYDACTPEVDGYRQPLCALYSNRAFEKLASLEDQCAMSWLNALDTRIVTEGELEEARIKPAAARGANTPAELTAAIKEN